MSPTNTPQPAPVGSPVPLDRFAAAIKGTRDEVWTHLLRQRHGSAKKTTAEWREAIASLKSER